MVERKKNGLPQRSDNNNDRRRQLLSPAEQAERHRELAEREQSHIRAAEISVKKLAVEFEDLKSSLTFMNPVVHNSPEVVATEREFELAGLQLKEKGMVLCAEKLRSVGRNLDKLIFSLAHFAQGNEKEAPSFIVWEETLKLYHAWQATYTQFIKATQQCAEEKVIEKLVNLASSEEEKKQLKNLAARLEAEVAEVRKGVMKTASNHFAVLNDKKTPTS